MKNKVWEACFLTRKVNSLCDLFYRHTHIKLFKPNRQTSHLKARAQPLGCAQLLATPWTAARQAPPSMGLSGQSTGVVSLSLLPASSRAGMEPR